MKKFFFSSAVVLVFIIYVVTQQKTGADINSTNPVSQLSTPPSPTDSASSTDTPISTQNPTSAPTTAPSNKPSGQYKDGQYTGPVTDAFYGNLQVKVAINNGQISDVTFLQYPNDRDTSRMINGQAMPILKQEAISSQKANVDIVSGATQTSQAFRQSMAVILSQAKAS